MYVGQDNDVIRTTSVLPMRWQRNLSNTLAFGSPHATAANFVFADGAVHVIAYDVDKSAYRSAGCVPLLMHYRCLLLHLAEEYL